MITSALLFAAGIILGLRFTIWVITFGSVLLTIASAAWLPWRSDTNLMTLLVLFAHLSALQGGYLLGQFISSKKGGPSL